MGAGASKLASTPNPRAVEVGRKSCALPDIPHLPNSERCCCSAWLDSRRAHESDEFVLEKKI